MTTEQGHILVVDDHRTNRLKLSLGLKQQGHTVDIAENGLQALDMLQAQSFDLVLLDIMMPEMDGYQVLEYMKADPHLRNIPVIVISALEEMDSIVKGIELGAEDYLPKTFDPILLKARIGACLEKKRLRDNEQLYLKGLERELEIGRNIQASFLPDKIPQLPGWEIAASFQAAREVAGDFYDAFPVLPDKKVGLLIGDVCGKGVGAALFMTLFCSLVRAVSNLGFYVNTLEEQPQAAMDSAAQLRNVVTLTNNYIAQTHRRAKMFSTLFFGQLDPDTGQLLYINGGHEPPLVINAQGIKTTLAPTGPVVGVFFGVDFKVQEVYLEPGDTLMAFTDGVTDARDPAGEMFSQDRLFALLEQPASSAANLLDRIHAQVQAHIAHTAQYDDVTMLAVRRLLPAHSL